MPDFCAAFGCGNKSCHTKCINERISFHRFPLKNPELLKQWLAKLKRKNFLPSQYSKICSEHFNDEDFTYETFTNRRLLKRNSVPTIFSFQKPTKKTSSNSGKAVSDGKGSWKSGRKVLDEGIYPEADATTLCVCDLPEKLGDGDIVKLASDCFLIRTDSLLNVSASRSKCGIKTTGKGGVNAYSLTSVVKQLNSAHEEIKELIHCIKLYEQEHVELHTERVSSLIRCIHLIKRNAVDGDIDALILLNQIAAYVPQE